jgi:hypothetical protein
MIYQLSRCLYGLGYQGHPTPRDNFAVHLYDKIQKSITRGILRFLFEILRFLFVYVVFNKKFLLKMRKSKKLPLEAEANQRKLFTWTKVVPPTGVTLFRKQGVATARVTLPAERS